MNSQQLLYINLVIGLFFVLYFFFFRAKPKGPTRLNLRAKSTTDLESEALAAAEAQRHQERQERQAKVAEVLQAKTGNKATAQQPVVLEVEPALAPQQPLPQSSSVLPLQPLPLSSEKLNPPKQSLAPPIASPESEPPLTAPPPASQEPGSSHVLSSLPKPKEMGIYFVYNAHEWESHDVLGVSRDCSLHQATEKYQQLIKTSDPSTFEFYGAAFDAILKRKGSK